MVCFEWFQWISGEFNKSTNRGFRGVRGIWDFMGVHGILMGFHGILMGFHGISW
jgi:hypothetical protein